MATMTTLACSWNLEHFPCAPTKLQPVRYRIRAQIRAPWFQVVLAGAWKCGEAHLPVPFYPVCGCRCCAHGVTPLLSCSAVFSHTAGERGVCDQGVAGGRVCQGRGRRDERERPRCGGSRGRPAGAGEGKSGDRRERAREVNRYSCVLCRWTRECISVVADVSFGILSVGVLVPCILLIQFGAIATTAASFVGDPRARRGPCFFFLSCQGR